MKLIQSIRLDKRQLKCLALNFSQMNQPSLVLLTKNTLIEKLIGIVVVVLISMTSMVKNVSHLKLGNTLQINMEKSILTMVD